MQVTTAKSTREQEPDATLYDLKGVSRVYGSGATAVRALDEIDLRIAVGEFAVIIGSSGSGKSTLLQLLGALDRPTDGRLDFEGSDLARASDRDLSGIRLRTIGFVFQQFNLIPTLSAAQNVELAMAPRGLEASVRTARALEMLELVGLADRAGHLPSELSGGEQQRVAIARALVNEPDVLLADEPTGNLDSKTGAQILRLLYELWERTGTTIVLITHDASIAETAPRVIRLADGRIAGDGREGITAIGPFDDSLPDIGAAEARSSR